MRSVKYIIPSFVLLLLSVSCSREPAVENGTWGHLTKAVNSPEGAEPQSVLVKFNSVPGLSVMDSLAVMGFTDVTKVFNSVKGKESLEREFGLDRWYSIGVSEGTGLEETALKLSEMSAVSVIEFKHHFKKTSDCKVYPLDKEAAVAATRAGGSSSLPFNDPYLSSQWHYINTGDASVATNAVAGADINVKDTWNLLSCGDPEIIVAVVDEGIQYNHPDLAANMWMNTGEIADNGIDDDGNGYVDDVYGYNFAANGAVEWTDPDNIGHGTHCAGTIAAVNNNGVGVSGVAGGSGKGDGCRLMSCQIFSGKKGGTPDVSARAIKYAADNGASVISCSYGLDYPFSSDYDYVRRQGTLELDAIHYFEASRNNSVLDGSIAIFSSGNSAKDFAYYPGAINDIISVSAFAPDFLPAYYTNYGPGCNISAPGGDYYLPPASEKSMVLSTVPLNIAKDGYAYMQGTSMACPHVSGIVALGLSYAKAKGKKFTRDEFKNMVLSSTNDIDRKIATSRRVYLPGAPAYTLEKYYHKMGTGAIDAWRLMMKIDGVHCSTAQLDTKQWIDLSSYFGSSSVSLTYLDVSVTDETVASLGLQKISGAADGSQPAIPDTECYAYVQFGRLYIHPTKIGSGTFYVKAVGGGSSVGGGMNPPGGMVISSEVSVIVRDVDGGNGTGGWL